MRKPIQALIFPYKVEDDKILYAIFNRTDLNIWQGIAGGGEDDETPLEAAKREAFEEAGISYDSPYICLSSICSIPVANITGQFTWGEDMFHCTEYSFGVNLTDDKLVLSSEHKKYMWTDYQTAQKMLRYDSNKTALWELNERLLRQKNKTV